MNRLMLIIYIWSVIQYYEKLWSSSDRKCSCWSMSVLRWGMLVIVRVWLVCFPEYFWKAIPSSSKHFGLVIYMMSNPNQGFMQEGWFLEKNVLPLLAFGPLDAVHKCKCSDKQLHWRLFRMGLLNNG